MHQKLSQGMSALQLKIFNFSRVDRLNLSAEQAPNPHAVKNQKTGNE